MIHARALAFRYPDSAALLSFGDVDLPQAGQALLLGRSGTGKSTWLALVAGLLVPIQGTLVVAGLDLTLAGARARDAWRGEAIGFLPQRLHLSDALSVRANLELPYFAAGLPIDRAAIDAALARLEVLDLADRRPYSLSGGQRLRVALARAVLRRPKVLLADEPTASLDDPSAARAMSLLTGVAADSGATLVVATHDTRVRAALAGAASILLDVNQQ